MMTKETNKLQPASSAGKEVPGPETLNRAALPIAALALPIVLESVFRMMLSSVDTIMLSSWSQEAVAGVGLVSQYIFFIQILFSVICVGTSIVLSQYLGAKRMEESGQVAQASALMVILAGLVMSAVVIVGAKPLLSAYRVETGVRTFAWQYLVVFGGAGSVFTAFSMLQGTILRSYGYTRDAMYIAVAANVLNVLGNALSLYGWFGLPVTGVVGVAASSAFSQAASCLLLSWRMRTLPGLRKPGRRREAVPRAIYRKILSIGVPTAGESLAYNVSQIVIMIMITSLGTWAMSAQVYAQTIVRFVYVIALSIGNAVQIKTGYWVGARQSETAYRKVWRYQLVGTLISVALVLLLNLVKMPAIGIFTREPEIAAIMKQLFIISLYIEIGRSLNLITIPALKGAGDVRFPVMMGIISMWGISVPFSYLLGIRLGLGMVGIWIALGTDEMLRGIVMLFRWKSRIWQGKAIV
jgi:putative efflux protein, MATE family